MVKYLHHHIYKLTQTKVKFHTFVFPFCSSETNHSSNLMQESQRTVRVSIVCFVAVYLGKKSYRHFWKSLQGKD